MNVPLNPQRSRGLDPMLAGAVWEERTASSPAVDQDSLEARRIVYCSRGRY